jgi:hypothetical protein
MKRPRPLVPPRPTSSRTSPEPTSSLVPLVYRDEGTGRGPETRGPDPRTSSSSQRRRLLLELRLARHLLADRLDRLAERDRKGTR